MSYKVGQTSNIMFKTTLPAAICEKGLLRTFAKFLQSPELNSTCDSHVEQSSMEGEPHTIEPTCLLENTETKMRLADAASTAKDEDTGEREHANKVYNI